MATTPSPARFVALDIHRKYLVVGAVDPLCWLLVVSGGQNWPVRTPLTVSYFLPIPKRQSTITSIDSLIFTEG
jgi:hypothetical protein